MGVDDGLKQQRGGSSWSAGRRFGSLVWADSWPSKMPAVEVGNWDGNAGAGRAKAKLRLIGGWAYRPLGPVSHDLKIY